MYEEIKILGESIKVSYDKLNIFKLKFLKDNPRVHACIHEIHNFENLTEEEQQENIYQKLLEEPSVKNLLPEIQRHNGLTESILVRLDRMEVIEGNSRLAVYWKLYRENESKRDNWERISCQTVSKMTTKQQLVYLNETHIKGKTRWSAYEQANFFYQRKKEGWTIKDIVDAFGESDYKVRKKIRAIEEMDCSQDPARSHFSYYDVLVRSADISRAMKEHADLQDFLWAEIKGVKSPEPNEDDFTAQNLRQWLPKILKKSKILKKYMRREIGLFEANQLAAISGAEEGVRKAQALLRDVSKQEVSELESTRFSAFKQSCRRLGKEVTRIGNIIKNLDEN